MKYVQDFFMLDGFVVLALITYLLRRAPRNGTRLRLQQGVRGSSLPASKGARTAPVFGGTRDSRQLTVNFNYNGHSWEAYEVLGLPAGSPFEQVQVAFEALALKSDPTSLPFYVAAVEAIRELSQASKGA
jgi:hypothetical protein